MLILDTLYKYSSVALLTNLAVDTTLNQNLKKGENDGGEENICLSTSSIVVDRCSSKSYGNSE